MNIIARKHQRSLFAKPNQSFLHSFFFPLFSFFAILFVSLASILAISQTSIFAAPPLHAPTPASINLTVSATSVDFHFTPAEMSASTFKSSNVIYPTASTNNTTGLTTYISSIDENTSLVHETSVTPEVIPSISADTLDTAFSPKTWGYTTGGSLYKPIPKASAPDAVYSTTSPTTNASTRVLFGVKSSPDLISGTYSKKVLFTAITNFAPKTATFLAGPIFNKKIANINTSNNAEHFKHSSVAPANLATATVVSSSDSDYPIYAWFDISNKTIYWWSEADTAYANEDSSGMFRDLGNNSSDILSIDVRGINASKVKNMSYMFHSGKFSIHSINLDGFDTSSAEDMSYMFASFIMGSAPGTLINFSHFDTSKVKNMEYMFSGSNLPSIDISSFDTSNVENMRYIFSNLTVTNSISAPGLNVKKVQNIGGMFVRSQNIASIDFSGWRLDSITNMSSMFAGIKNLTTLNLTGFLTPNVQDMSNMFSGLESLTSLDLSSFNTSKVTDMRYMFNNMYSLTNLNISNFNTQNVTNMSSMFAENRVLTNLDLSNFNTSKVTTMSNMFQGMAKLSSLNLASFDTKNVTNMNSMFYWAMMDPENGTLDISSFNTQSLTSASGMFFYSKVKTIYVSSNFVTTAITTPQDLFISNTNLQGGNGTVYVYPNNSYTFAHIDAPGNPGYFTQK